MNDFPGALSAGTEVGGYRIESVLGVGGFTVTYLATQLGSSLSVVLKEYFPFDFATRGSDGTASARSSTVRESFDTGLERFAQSGRFLARLRHPNLLTASNFLEANGTAYLVQDRLEGANLEEVFPEGEPASDPETVMDVIGGMIAGLDVIHTAGFVHGNIGPLNVMLVDRTSPVLVNLDTALAWPDERTDMTTTYITPGYSPLEQYLADREKLAAIDIYATAAVAIRLITGEPPPEAPHRAVAKPQPRLADQVLYDYPAQFLDALDHGFAVMPEDRPQSVIAWRAEMADAT